MGAFLKLIDAILFLFFIVIAVAAPLFDSQTILRRDLYPDVLVDVKQWYTREYGDYLISEKPSFFVGLVWLEILFQWPLCLFNLYGLLCSKSWYPTTCLIYGVSVFTAMVAILFEFMGSGKASDKLMMVYIPFMGLGIVATLRGLVPHSGKTASVIGKRPGVARKKRV